MATATITVGATGQAQQLRSNEEDTLLGCLFALVEYEGESLQTPIPISLTAGGTFETDPLEVAIPEDLQAFVRLPYEPFRAWCESVFRDNGWVVTISGGGSAQMNNNVMQFYPPAVATFEANPPSAAGW